MMNVLIADHRRKRYYPHAPMPEIPSDDPREELKRLGLSQKFINKLYPPEPVYVPVTVTRYQKATRSQREGLYVWQWVWIAILMVVYGIKYLFSKPVEEETPEPPAPVIPKTHRRRKYKIRKRR